MKVLHISDIHLRLNVVKRILNRYESEVDHVVFHGDYADNWEENSKKFRTSDTRSTFRWLKDNLYNPKYTFLMGNHDLPYAFKGYPPGWASCPGWTEYKHDIVRAIMTEQDWRHLKFTYETPGGILCSHAGVDRTMFPPNGIPEDMDNALWDCVQDGIPHPWLLAGQDRGGMTNQLGGPLWIDWSYFSSPDEVYQLVGHTIVPEPQKHRSAICFDTNNRHIIISEGKHRTILEHHLK